MKFSEHFEHLVLRFTDSTYAEIQKAGKPATGGCDAGLLHDDGGQNVTVWKGEVPLTVAGFNFGRFKVEEAKLTNPQYLVQAYANEEPPDEVKALVARAGGIIPTGGLIQRISRSS